MHDATMWRTRITARSDRAMLRSLLVFSIAAIASCRSHPREITIAAAVSLKEPLEQIARTFEAEHPGEHVSLSFGASGDLATQIQHGAPVDLFASAARDPADKLVASSQADAACMLATNALVLIRRNDPRLRDLSWSNLATHPAITHIAIGLVPSVPAGKYAESTLAKLNILDSLGPKLVRGGNVRQVLDLVARGEADCGIVYATDARGRSDVVVVGEPPKGSAPSIEYPLVTIRGHVDDHTRPFRDFMCSDRARATLQSYGFTPP
jgi:molybdate transport system substrate-binding protein